MKIKIPKKLTSRKFWLATIAFIIILACRIFKVVLPIELELAFVAVIVAFIGGESYIDSKRVENEGGKEVEL